MAEVYAQAENAPVKSWARSEWFGIIGGSRSAPVDVETVPEIQTAPDIPDESGNADRPGKEKVC